MKKITAVAFLVLLFGCKSELEQAREDLKAKRAEFAKVKGEIKEIEAKIEQLDTAQVSEDYPKVIVKAVKLQTFESFVDVHGVVESDKNVMVMPESQGIIRSISVRNGQQVRKGQVLGVIDTEIVQKNIGELKKNLEFATEVFNKQKALFDQKVGTEMQYLEAKNRKEGLEQSLKTLQSQASKGIVRSPIDGKIDEVYPKTGEMASPQTPFVRIVNTNDVYLNLDVSESFLNKINVGDEVQARFPYQKDTLTVKVDYKGNYINPNNRTFKVHCNVHKSHKTLPPNLLAVVRLKNEALDSAVVVPTNIIQNDGKSDFVFVIEGGKAVKKPVKTGATYQVSTVIKEGLKVEDVLVVEGHKGLTNHAKVDVLKK